MMMLGIKKKIASTIKFNRADKAICLGANGCGQDHHTAWTHDARNIVILSSFKHFKRYQ